MSLILLHSAHNGALPGGRLRGPAVRGGDGRWGAHDMNVYTVTLEYEFTVAAATESEALALTRQQFQEILASAEWGTVLASIAAIDLPEQIPWGWNDEPPWGESPDYFDNGQQRCRHFTTAEILAGAVEEDRE